jgi:Protein of unknown function (DUF3159)
MTEETAGPPPAGTREQILAQIGGWRGLFDSALPVVVFVLANTIAGLTVAIWSALGAGLLVAVLRLLRRQSTQQVLSGLLGVALAAYIAHRTGSAKGFFLFGIWASFGYAAVFGGSLLVRWPLVGLVWEYIEPSPADWRRERPMMRVYTWTTVMWTGVFLARGLVQHFLYDADRTGWLAVARIAMGYPVTLGALGVTLLAVRRASARHRVRPPTQPAPLPGQP